MTRAQNRQKCSKARLIWGLGLTFGVELIARNALFYFDADTVGGVLNDF